MDALLLCASLLTLSVGTYVIWPNRWNVPAHLNLGFCLVAYIIPIYFTRTLLHFQPALVHFCTLLVLLGAVTYVAGLLLGQYGRPLARLPLGISFGRFTPVEFLDFALKRTRLLTFGALAGMWISFAVMGFIPAFAQFPIMAKFFHGIYAIPYQRVEILYRGSYFVLIAVLPLTFTGWLTTRRSNWMLLTAAGVATVAVTLVRGQIVTGLLLVIGLVAARKRRWTILYIAIVVLAFPIGALLYKLLGILAYYRQGFWQTIASGSPDVQDCLNFLYHYLGRPALTYGRTFWGGLIPGHYEWNPSVYSLIVISNHARLNDIGSGGLRLPAPVWGYTAFGWTGAALVPFLSGLAQARFILFVRRSGEGKPLMQAAVVYLFYLFVGVSLAEFYSLSIYMIPMLVVYSSFLYLYRAPRPVRAATQADLPAQRWLSPGPGPRV